jgi:hypothetical protein
LLAATALPLVVGCSGARTAPRAEDVVRPGRAEPPEPAPAATESTQQGPADAGADAGTEPPPPAATSDGRVELDDEFPAGTESLSVRELAHVLRAPRDRARYIGKITRGTRVGWKRVVAPDREPGPRRRRSRRKPCSAWVEIEPRGYLCRDLLRPTDEPPDGTPQPEVREGQLTPDSYYKVLAETDVYLSADDVRAQVVERQLSTKVMVTGRGTVDVDGVVYRRTDHGLVEAAALRRLWPSSFAGRRLEDPASVTWPFGWIHFEPWARAPYVREGADAEAPRVRRAARRELVTVHEERDGFLRIGHSEWVERKYVRLARLTAPPPTVTTEQWVDVDLDEQVLVAYEGGQPVFATLVSTGATRHPTPVGTYRVRAKAATTPMAGDPDAPNRYEVSEVPWAVRFASGFYIHGAYWHDGFGGTRSHGCVNVSPKDAAFVYDWIGPAAPAGWSEVEVPGGQGVTIRIRDEAHPTPPPFDYAPEEPWNFPAVAESSR